MRNDIKLKSQNAKYPNHKWVESDDGFSMLIAVTEYGTDITVWDINKRPVTVSHAKGHGVRIRGF